MRRDNLKLALLALTILAVVFVAVWNNDQHSFSVTAQRDWIRGAVQELAQAGPPPVDPKRENDNSWWALPGYLIFSNGWAAYKINTIHDRPEVGDATVLRTSDGACYLSQTHFCTGIGEMMKPRPVAGELSLRPVDAAWFFAHYGKWQRWDLFAPDNRLWCVINAEGEHLGKKPLWVWISSGDGTNRTTLFEHKYAVHGAFVSWATHWLSNDCVVVDFFDYGTSPRLYPGSVRSNHIMSLSFGRDSKTGHFIERR